MQNSTEVDKARALCKFHIVSPNKLAFSLHILDQNLLDQIRINEPKKHILIFALDTSGSMSGSALTNAKKGIIQLLSNASIFEDFEEIVLLSYHEIVNYVDSLTRENYMSEVNNQRCGGSTNFVAAFNTIEQLINSKTNDVDKAQVQVCFLTDGCHNCGGNAYETIASLKQKCLTKFSHLEVGFHCIGFTSSHDVKMMQSIIAIGNAQGSFQYAAGSAELDVCITQLQNVFDATMGEEMKSIVLQMEQNKTKKIKLKTLDFVETNTPLKIETVHSVLNGFTWKIPLQNNKELNLNDIGMMISPMDSVGEELQIELLAHQEQLVQLTKKLEASQDVSIEELAYLDDKLTKIVNEDKRFKGSALKKVEKSQIFDKIKELKDRLAKLYTIQKNKKKQQALSNHELATLLSSTYDFITKKHLQKKLDKRVVENMELLDKADEVKSAILKKCEFELDESNIYPQSLENYKCIISTRSWVECVLEKTAIGFGIEMSRTQAAIADPAQIQIINIAPCVVSVESFMNSAQFRLESLQFDELKLHGGFQGKKNGNSSSVIEGLGRENINGLIPLYINKNHWLMAKQEAKGLFGWMTTCDIFGFEKKQLYTIPLVALASFLRMEKWSEVHAQFFLQLWRTCRALTVETTEYSTHFKMEDYSKYENRTSDKISSHMLLLGKVMTDSNLIKEWKMEDFVLAIIEEEVRRNCRQLEDSYETKLIQLLHCDKLVQMKKDIKPSQLWEMYETEKQQCNTQEESDTLMKKEIVFDTIAVEIDKVSEMMDSELRNILSTKFLLVLLKFVTLMEQFFSQYDAQLLVQQLDNNHGVVPQEMIYNLVGLFNGTIRLQEQSKATDWISDFSALIHHKSTTTLLNKKMIQGLIIQCFAHRNNATRRDAAANNSILNPFFQSDSIVEEFVVKCKRTQIGRILNLCQQDFNFENRFKRYTVEQFLDLAKDSISQVYHSWLQQNKVCFKDAIFYDVKTQFNHSVAARRDILKVDEDQAMKEMIFLSKATNKPVLIGVTGSKKILEGRVDNQYEQKHGKSLDIVFPDESEVNLKNGLTLNSIPLWSGLVEQDSMIMIWDKFLMSEECNGVYGASGIAHILVYLPRSTLNALFQLKEKKDWNLFTVARF